ncbi:UvrD-helicase domain-containing protein [Halobacterium sp. NMX12-1]|uniref:DNA 3'-5' helicase n=1 Tax=Halobacterium sp. NMX12-1 TaxID=3166650 RepID=A0AAU8CDE8_9EURY
MPLLEVPEDVPSIFDDEPQTQVFEEYHEGSGRVVVGAGAGTGKTTTLIDTVAEAILQKLNEEEGNPMDDLLITTFTKDAAGELKTKLKERLRVHEAASGEQLNTDIWRWIETDSYVETIDSFTHRLLREVAIEAGISPGFEVRDGLEEEDLYDEIMEEMRDQDDLEDSIARLEEAYPNEDWRAFPPDDLQDLLIRAHNKSREFCWTPEEMGERLMETHQQSHAELEPDFTVDEVREIAQELTGQFTFPGEDVAEHASEIYRHNQRLIEDFSRLLVEFDERYNDRTVEQGLLSHTDITYLVWKQLNENPNSDWAEGLSERFDHVFVDEFQDTSFAQCRILAHCFQDSGERTNALLIGDVKQSIYQWRSADPRIFADIIDFAIEEDGDNEAPYLEIDGLAYLPLTTNFRSHPELVESANHIFDSIFTDPGRGDIGPFNIPFEAATASRASEEPDWAANGNRLHVLDLGNSSSKSDWRQNEPVRVAETVSGLIGDDQTPVLDEDETESLDEPVYRQPRAGDITLLFNRRSAMAPYAEMLREYGVDCAIDVSKGLFNEPEIELLIEVLNWFANPHSKDSLIRILRSPVTALDDRTLRYLASEKYYLTTALEDWPDELPENDESRLRGLIALRDDLRWEREKNKASLIQDIIQHTGFDSVVLAGEDGKQKFANLWLVAEIVTEWEDEELLSYNEFVTRLKRLQSRANRGEDEHPLAKISDEESETTVRLTTVHQSKGLEYPIVILPDLCYAPRDAWFPWNNRMMLSRDGVGLRPDIGDEQPVQYGAGGSDFWITDDPNPTNPFAVDGLATTWITGTRSDTNGSISDDHPLAENYAATLAEFWRSLYVAYTRAADHLFVGLSSSNRLPGPDEYSTWATSLTNLLKPDQLDNWQPGTFSREITYRELDGVDEVSIGIDDIEPGEMRVDEEIGMEIVEESITQNRRHEVDELENEFFPSVVKPTSIHDILACPLRFQYSELEEVSAIRADIPPGSEPPGGLHPTQWGDIVHKLLENAVIGEEEAGEYAEGYEQEIKNELLDTVLANFEGSEIGQSLTETDVTALPEHDVRVYVDELDTYVSGQLDLVYEDSEGWHVVDFKTGRVADEDEYIGDSYRLQLAAYTWLFDKAYDVEIESAKLAYVHPSLEIKSMDVSPSDFEDAITEVQQLLEIVPNQGLPATPDPTRDEISGDPPVSSKCGSCAYRSRCPEWSD